MRFKGRTVFAFVLLAMFASSIITLTFVDSSIFAERGSRETSLHDTGKLAADDLNKISKTYGLIESRFLNDVEKAKVVDGAINGMLSALNDPYTVYMDKEEAGHFQESIESSFTGIGAEVTMENGNVKVIAPIKGSPAEKAGIHSGDVILSVNGEALQGLTINEAVAKIRGAKGTQAKLEILRGGTGEPVQIIVVRDKIDLETVYSEMIDGQIGKIEIRQFAQNTAKRFEEELAALEAKGMKALIIDVRNDPGGVLPVVVEIAEQLVPKGKTIVQVEDRTQKRVPTVSNGKGKPYPIAVLINKGSASASEILAAALKESAGGRLIGETTFGKGTVQYTFAEEMGDGSNIKMTVAKWLTPNGNWIHNKGIAPDIAVSQPAFFRVAPLSKKTELEFDTVGEDVKNLQIMLDGLGFKPGRTDGYFSEGTVRAVKAFQKAHKLPVTGKVDKKTAASVEEAIMKEILSPKNDLQLKSAVDYLQNLISK